MKTMMVRHPPSHGAVNSYSEVLARRHIVDRLHMIIEKQTRIAATWIPTIRPKNTGEGTTVIVMEASVVVNMD